MKTLLTSKYLVWTILALPGIGMLFAVYGGAAEAIKSVLHPSGEFSARFMIAAMMVTPLRLLFPTAGLVRWLLKHRRALGVAAFLYGLLHTVLYILHTGTLDRVVTELPYSGIWTGWLAMLLFVPLGLTSNNASVKALKTAWKKLQRLVYPAAVLALLHWVLVNDNVGAALLNFAPLAVLQTYRIWREMNKPISTT